MNLMIFIPLLFALQIFYWFVGRASSQNLKDKQDYYLAGKNISFFPLMMTFLAAQVGGGLVIGAAREAYQFGWSVILLPLGTSVGLILLGLGFGKRLASFKVATVAEILEVAYGSRCLKVLASILSIVSLFMILVGQFIASKQFLGSLGFSNNFLFIIFWAIVIIYTAQGGLRAVVSTDLVQALFFSIVFFVAIGFAFSLNPTASFQTLKPHNFTFDSSKIYGWFFMPLLFMLIEQDMGQRCFAGRCSKTVSRATLIAGISTLIICIIPIFFGILAQEMNLIPSKGSSLLMLSIAKTTNQWIAAIVGCAILAAVVSTATSLINAIGSNLSHDFEGFFLKKKENIRIMQRMTAIISIAAIFFTFYLDNIVSLLVQSYELSVSCLFIPIFIALFKRKGNFLSALLAILLGALSFFLFRFFPPKLPKELLSVLISLFGFGLGEALIWYSSKKQT